jgi:hypothetical protein
LSGTGGYDIVHEAEKFNAAASLRMRCNDLSPGDLKRCNKVVVTVGVTAPGAKLGEREPWFDGEVLPHDAGRLVRLPLSR